MAIVPDRADWTWVLEKRCPECGLDTTTIDRRSMAELVLRLSRAWQEMLHERSEISVRTRPRQDRWSPLEYSCHVVDVLEVSQGRFDLMIAGNEPAFPNWDQDATAEEKCYSQHAPGPVGEGILRGGTALARSYAGVSGADWGLAGHRSDGSAFTIERYGRYLIHDVFHHLWDVGEPFAV